MKGKVLFALALLGGNLLIILLIFLPIVLFSSIGQGIDNLFIHVVKVLFWEPSFFAFMVFGLGADQTPIKETISITVWMYIIWSISYLVRRKQ